MKQLLRQSGSYLILGLGDAVYVAEITAGGATAAERWWMLAPSDNDDDNSSKDPTLLQVQAVDIHQEDKGDDETGVLLQCAVARRNKSLALYTLDIKESTTKSDGAKDTVSTTNTLQPSLVHTTEKRITALCSTTIGSSPVWLAADVLGDATAWSRSSGHRSRLVAGHTASMLTTLTTTFNNNNNNHTLLYTADRDEKIRLTSIFPSPNIIQGYLLGHTAYVTDVVIVNDGEQGVVVSSGGDGTIRLWQQQRLVDTLSLSTTTEAQDDNDNEETSVPVKLAVINDSTVAVIYDGGRQQKCVQLVHLVENKRKLQAGTVTDLVAPPLGIVAVQEQPQGRGVVLYVLLRDTPYLQVLAYDDAAGERDAALHTADETPSRLAKRLQQTMNNNNNDSNTIPAHILERDHLGNRLLEKVSDQRALVKPWLKGERVNVDAQRLKRQRSHKRRRTKYKQKLLGGETGDIEDVSSDDNERMATTAAAEVGKTE